MEEILSFLAKFWFFITIIQFIAGFGLTLMYPHVNQPQQVLNQYQQATSTSILIFPCDGQASSVIYQRIVKEYTPKYIITSQYWAPPPKDAWYIELKLNSQ